MVSEVSAGGRVLLIQPPVLQAGGRARRRQRRQRQQRHERAACRAWTLMFGLRCEQTVETAGRQEQH